MVDKSNILPICLATNVCSSFSIVHLLHTSSNKYVIEKWKKHTCFLFSSFYYSKINKIRLKSTIFQNQTCNGYIYCNQSLRSLSLSFSESLNLRLSIINTVYFNIHQRNLKGDQVLNSLRSLLYLWNNPLIYENLSE